ncbi:hypothetical protein [Noviherbaspirillum saxi]|uniref:Lipoprotein n=1 Tax=Noviherbaspirillum saxi TaxID=2320863 RepID=A0A3A3FID0_9BURK|nr:hypothetical protein [Noviherbaspirillum saxi]RJF95253.1 hypothetical protein D3871_17590 [Noviherbaspirillum saxi]
MRHIIVSFMLAAMLCGCGNKVEEDSYFPLATGTRWAYTVSSESDGNASRENHVISVIKQITQDNRQVAVRRSESEQNIGVEYWISTLPDRFVRIAQRSDLEERATMDAQPRTVLPVPLRKGSAWTTLTTTYFILRKSEFPRELKYSHKALMTYTVESVDETVTVPAGQFSNCARVSGLAFLTLYTDPVRGFHKVPLVTNEWYCKGIGLVKLERIEELSTAFFSGGKMSMELTEYVLP